MNKEDRPVADSLDEPTVEMESEAIKVAAANGSSDSLLSRLREQRSAIGQDRRFDLDVPGYNGMLVVRYKPVSWDDLKKIANKVEESKSPRRELMGHADYLIAACDMFLIREEDGRLIPIHERFSDMFDDDEPVRYDHRLAKFLGIEGENLSARQIVLAAFNNPVAVTAQHNEVGQWNQSSQREDDEGF